MIIWNLDHFEIDKNLLTKWRATYPNFDTELLKIEAWYLANPRRAKKNLQRFIVNWLNKGVVPKTPAEKKYERDNADFRKLCEKMEREVAPPTDEWLKLKESLK